jgi:exopolysaccharide/PEP-CTERM locus tyrosine autokinase
MSIIEKALQKAEIEKNAVASSVEKNNIDNTYNAPDLKDNATLYSTGGMVNAFIEQTPVSSNIQAEINKIDWERLKSNGFLGNEKVNSQLAEEFRVIKRPLINNALSTETHRINRPNLILVCSSIPGEGKTFISINLALSIANELDTKVLLIDADVEKPSISKQMGIPRGPGLIEYLENPRINFNDVVLRTDLSNLSIIPAGKKHKLSTELLASQRMYELTDELNKRYHDRIVIFDSAPLLAATQADVLAELVGQIVFVIAARSTLQSVVNEALSKIDKCDMVFPVLNKITKNFGSGHGYGYGYGHYGQ